MIKFRAWDKKLEMMIDVVSIDFIEKTLIGEHWEYGYTVPISFSDAILMQSTGLFDKNGVEVFEGDVLETIYRGKLYTGVVVYDQKETDFKATDGRNEYGNNFYYLGGNDSNIVIGNVHQHPELLKNVEMEWWKLNDLYDF